MNLVIFKDVIEVKEFEEWLWKLDIFYVVGEFVVGIVYEIRNLMMVLKGFI